MAKFNETFDSLYWNIEPKVRVLVKFIIRVNIIVMVIVRVICMV